MGQRLSFVRRGYLALLSSALALLITTSARADLTELLASRLGSYFLTETSAGELLSERLLGHALGDETDTLELLSRLRAGENSAVSRELEARLLLAESRFRAEANLGENADLAGLSPADRALLEHIASDFLGVRPGAGARIEFVTELPESYLTDREAFLRGGRPSGSGGPAVSAVTRADLQRLGTRYGAKPEQILFTPENRWPGVVKGLTNEGRMAPALTGPVLPHPGGAIDTVVVGSGPAGLTSGLVLSDGGQKVLVLEAAPKIGGLANGERIGQARFGSGAAYYAAPSRPQFRLMQRLGLNNYTRLNGIRQSIDSLLLDGVLYKDFWDEPTIDQLPSSFKLYKHCVQRMDKLGMIADQPIEAAENLELDQYTAKEVIDRMPQMIQEWNDPASRRIYEEFLNDPRIDPANPMKHVYSYLDPYGRSALGGTTEKVNAMAFFNFQGSELEPRYTGPTGTGEITERFTRLLNGRPELVSMLTDSPVAKIIKHPDWVEILYVKGGKTFSVRAKNVVFSAPMKVAPKLIQGFETLAPEHAAALARIPYTDYIVTNVVTEGHPTEGTYDFWFGNTDNQNLWPTDVINGRFQQFGTTAPTDNTGVLTLYQPVGEGGLRNFTPEAVFARAEESIQHMNQLFGPTVQMNWGNEIKPKWIIANAYPASIQLMSPGYFREIAPVFRKPIAGVIYPAGIVNGTPSLEEAMYSGQHAAENILRDALARHP